MHDYIVLNSSVVDCALSHNLKACIQDPRTSFSMGIMYIWFMVMHQSINLLFNAHVARVENQAFLMWFLAVHSTLIISVRGNRIVVFLFFYFLYSILRFYHGAGEQQVLRVLSDKFSD